MTVIANPPYPSYFDVDGSPLEDGYIYFGAANQNPETNPITVYWDSAYTQPALQPIRTSGGFTYRAGTPANIYVSTDFSITVRDKNRRLVYSKLLSEGQTTAEVNLQYSTQAITATAAQTVFGLSTAYTPGNNSLAVYHNGSRLIVGQDYTETTSTSITLAIGATAGDVLQFVTATPINPSSLGAAAVAYVPAGTGAVATNVQAKLRETVSVKDFGAVGDGVTDDTAAIQAALNAGSIYIPDGTYIVSSVNVTASNRSVLGQSKNAVLKRKSLTYLPVLLATGVDYFYANGFEIDGNKSGCPLTGFTPSGGGSAIAIDSQGDIVCRNGSYARIDNVSFINSCTSPALLYNMASSAITDCTSVGHAREGFYLVSGYECTISRCVSRGDATQPYSLIATTGLASDSWSHKHTIANNVCYDSQAAFITVNTIATQIYGNIIGKALGLASTGPGIRLGHDIAGQSAEWSRVFDNYVFGVADVGSGGTGRGISIENADKCEVFDNRVYACRTGVGASVAQNSDFIVRDNFTDACVATGYDLYNVIGAQVYNNISRTCPTGFAISGQNLSVSNNYVIGASTVGYNVNATSGLNSGHVFDGNKTDSTTTSKWSVASPSNHTFTNNEYGSNQLSATTISGATPSAIAGNLFTVTNASATNMTALADWKEGALYVLFFSNGNTTLKQSGSFRLKGGVDVTPSAGNIMQFLASGSLFYEVSRSF
jgi:hypothetical protein